MTPAAEPIDPTEGNAVKTVVLRLTADGSPGDEDALVKAFAALKGIGGVILIDGGEWLVHKEMRLPANVTIRGTNQAILRLPGPCLVSKAVRAGGSVIPVDRNIRYRPGAELAVLPPGEGKERIATVRIKSIAGRTLRLADPLGKSVPAGSRIGTSHRMFLGYGVTNVTFENLAIDGGRDRMIPMPGHHLRSAIWISAPYSYEQGPIGQPAANITVKNCAITNCYGRAVAFYHTIDSSVTDCRIGGLNDEAIDFDHFAKRCRAIKNKIDGATIGVELNDASDCQVLRNQIRNVHIGVRIWWYNKFDPVGLNEGNLIQDNRIEAATRAAVTIGRNCFGNRVLQNSVEGKVEAVESDNRITGNIRR